VAGGAHDISVDAEPGRTGGEANVRAARVAFVRLYDGGLLERAERVVDVCSRCRTVVEPTDASALPTDVVRYTLRVADEAATGPTVDVGLVELELLPGVVAVAVPVGHDAVNAIVRVPLGKDVPVIAEDDVEEPWFVVPAHDAVALDFARRHNLVPVPVLDRDGAVIAEGAVCGLARFAARAAATEIVAAEGAIVAEAEVSVDLMRCGRCATPLVPVLGWHWFLRTADLEVAAADAIREGAVTLDDVEARDRFVDRAERADSWCLSHQVWAGDAVPAARCTDCGQVAVTAEPSSSCGKCMGELVSTDDVLDARFVAALWPLAHAGWPNDERAAADAAPSTVVFAGADDVTGFALPVAALGLRLAGAVPYGELVCVRLTEDQPEAS
jgi:valyl-tRNA synthetase